MLSPYLVKSIAGAQNVEPVPGEIKCEVQKESEWKSWDIMFRKGWPELLVQSRMARVLTARRNS
jgi:hypothetical protein